MILSSCDGSSNDGNGVGNVIVMIMDVVMMIV